MEIDEHIDALTREGRLLADAARAAGPASPVPTCPGWRTRDLLAHVGFVHRWAARYVSTSLADMVEEPGEGELLASAPPDDERCTWVVRGHAELVGSLRGAPRDLSCWTFLPAPSPLAMWSRRQAHETTVHRVDAELAAGRRPTPVDAALAVDGIDELVLCFLARPPREVAADAVEGTIALEPDDLPDRWTLRCSPDGVRGARGTARGADPCDAVVRGSASDLYLMLWHRRPVEGLVASGSAELFRRLWDERKVTWS